MRIPKVPLWLERLLLAAALVGASLFFFYTFENWRGKRAWHKHIVELETAGERFDCRAYALAPVPDDQNFVATPFLKAISIKGKTDPLLWSRVQATPLADYSYDCSTWRVGRCLDLRRCQAFLQRNQAVASEFDPANAPADLLASMADLEAEFLELRRASQRPFAQFSGDPNPLSDHIPNFVALRKLAYLLALRASAELELGRIDEAFSDLQVICRLAASLKSEPNLISVMISSALIGNMGMQVCWEGLVTRRWSDEHLRRIQQMFGEFDLLAQFDWGMRGEAAGIHRVVDRNAGTGLKILVQGSGPASGPGQWIERLYYRSLPRGWVYQNRVFYDRLLLDTAFGNYNVRSHRIFPERCRASCERLDQAAQTRSPFASLALMGIPNFGRALESLARAQTALNQAGLAAGLELYQRSHGEYPSGLEALLPDLAAKIPQDLLADKPLLYRRSGPGEFLLYSVGWDQKDDGGQPPAAPGVSPGSQTAEDWVWPRAM